MEMTVPDFLLGLAWGRDLFPRRPWWLVVPRNPSPNFHTLKTHNRDFGNSLAEQREKKKKAIVTVIRLLEELL